MRAEERRAHWRRARPSNPRGAPCGHAPLRSRGATSGGRPTWRSLEHGASRRIASKARLEGAAHAAASRLVISTRARAAAGRCYPALRGDGAADRRKARSPTSLAFGAEARGEDEALPPGARAGVEYPALRGEERGRKPRKSTPNPYSRVRALRRRKKRRNRARRPRRPPGRASDRRRGRYSVPERPRLRVRRAFSSLSRILV